MRICYVGDAQSIHTLKWAKYFAEAGHDVHLISHRAFGAVTVPQLQLHVPRHFERFRGGNLALAWFQLSRLLRRIKPDVLHGHYTTGGGFWGALAGFHPYVLTAWGSDVLLEPKASRWAAWKTRFALSHADLLTCDADHFVRPMVALGAPREKVNLINFGIDTKKFHPGRRDEALRRRLQGGTGGPLVLSLRTFAPRYDVESFIRAVPLVLQEVPEARFIAAGDGELRGELEALAASLGVADRVAFIGWMPNDELPAYLASVDVYVSTSTSDAGIASSTAEAMACEVPAVVTDFGDNGTWVKDGQGGFLVPLRSPEAVAEKVVRLLRDEPMRRRFGAFNRQVICERNDYYVEMAKVEKLYESLVENGRR